MTDTIAVVKPHYLIEEAYRMGHDRFKGLEVDSVEDFELSHFKETATWANTVAPDLRAMAGFDDGGHGTFQINRKVAAIRPGCEEDEPADAELVESHQVFEKLVEAFDTGAYDGVEDTHDPASVQW